MAARLLIALGCVLAARAGQTLSAQSSSAAPSACSGAFTASASAHLGRPPATSLVNHNGSPRIADAATYAAVLDLIAPILDSAAADPRLALDPNYVAALLMKESGADSLAESARGAVGLAQLTAATDADLRVLTTGRDFGWMRDEVARWPADYRRHPAFAARAAAFWLRMLEAKWTLDAWPGGYGALARTRLGAGSAVDGAQLLALATVSYNQGYEWVAALVERHGPAWRSHLTDQGPRGEEAADYLERVETYCDRFRRAR